MGKDEHLTALCDTYKQPPRWKRYRKRLIVFVLFLVFYHVVWGTDQHSLASLQCR